MTLFDPGAPAEPPAALSYDQRLTIRRRQFLERGVHPTTRLPTLDDGRTCKDCPHAFSHHRAKTYWKCSQVAPTHGPATDIRVSWPACTAIDAQPRQR